MTIFTSSMAIFTICVNDSEMKLGQNTKFIHPESITLGTHTHTCICVFPVIPNFYYILKFADNFMW